MEYQYGWVMMERLRHDFHSHLFKPYEPYRILRKNSSGRGMFVESEDEMENDDGGVLILREHCAFLPRGDSWWIIEPDEEIE